MSRVKMHGNDLALYKIHAIRKGKKVGTIKVFAHTRTEAYYSVSKLLPKHDNFDYEHLRFAEDDEMAGVVMNKNDIKRKP